MPNARLAYKLSPERLLWAALSRAARVPSRIDRDIFIPGPPASAVLGGPGFVSEIAAVAEVGYRAVHGSDLTYSATLFHHDFSRLRTLESGPLGSVLANNMRGALAGIEGWGSYRISPALRLSAGGTLRHSTRELTGGSRDARAVAREGNDPKRTAQLRLAYAATARHDVDLAVRHVSALPDPRVPAYTAVDLRLGWRAQPALEFSLAVQNLLDRSHVEWRTATVEATVERSILVRALWKL
ncbi:MAG TPA: TonB-dependent receptor, partial [Burkholderiaceae bacterium]